MSPIDHQKLLKAKQDVAKRIAIIRKARAKSPRIPGAEPALKQAQLYQEYARTYEQEGRTREAVETFSVLKQKLDEYLRAIRSWIGIPRLANAGKKAKKSTKVQTLIFDKKTFNKKQALSWAKDHGFQAKKVDETPKSYRIRQISPRGMKVMRTISLRNGVKAVVGR